MASALAEVAGILAPGASVVAIPWQLVRYQHVAAVRACLLDRAPAGANKVLSALRGVLRQAWMLGQMSSEDYQRAAAVPNLRGSRVAPGRALSVKEVRQLFLAIDQTTTSGARDAALLALAVGVGLRRAEMAALRLANYETTGKVLKVVGKGDKQREVPIDDWVLVALEGWIRIRGPHPGPIFHPILRSGLIRRDRGMTGQAIYGILERLGAAAELAHFSPHDLRRTCISDLLDAGADVVVVSQIVGHASPVTTSKYDRRGERAKRRAIRMLQVPFGGGDPCQQGPKI
jgi:integrase